MRPSNTEHPRYTCRECGGQIDGKASENFHIYTHLQEMWPERDYSEKIAKALAEMNPEPDLPPDNPQLQNQGTGQRTHRSVPDPGYAIRLIGGPNSGETREVRDPTRNLRIPQQVPLSVTPTEPGSELQESIKWAEYRYIEQDHGNPFRLIYGFTGRLHP